MASYVLLSLSDENNILLDMKKCASFQLVKQQLMVY